MLLLANLPSLASLTRTSWKLGHAGSVHGEILKFESIPGWIVLLWLDILFSML